MVTCRVCEKLTCDPSSGLCPECWEKMMYGNRDKHDMPEALWPYRGKKGYFYDDEWVWYQNNAERYRQGKISKEEFVAKREEITQKIVEEEKRKKEKYENPPKSTERACPDSEVFGT